jgi:predicted nucleotidyltransferase
MAPSTRKRLLQKVVEYLKKKGCRRVMVFGSFAHGEPTADSDLDIAVTGLSGRAFFEAVAMLPLIANRRVDLVDIDDVPRSFRETIERTGEPLYGY